MQLHEGRKELRAVIYVRHASGTSLLTTVAHMIALILPLAAFSYARSQDYGMLASFAVLFVCMQLMQLLMTKFGPKLEVGTTAPKLEALTMVQGSADATALALGKVTVVEFWATWCPPCKTAIPHLNEMYKSLKGQGVEFVGVTAEDEGKVRAFIAELGDKFTYPVALDPTRAVSNAYPSTGIPNAYVVGKDGKVAWSGHPMGGLQGAIDKALAAKAE